MPRCSFPFPAGANPRIDENCDGCPNSGADRLDEARACVAIRSLGNWLWEGAIESRVEPIRAEALRCYFADTTICIPKALLRAHRAVQTIAPWDAPAFSKNARYAFRGLTVPSWPDSKPERGVRWEDLDRSP